MSIGFEMKSHMFFLSLSATT